MKVTVKQLTDYLISRTDNESDDQLFWNELVVRWETEKTLIESETTWESHVISIWWDLERLGWVTSDFNWSRSPSSRFIWSKHEVYPQSDNLFSFSVDNPQKMYWDRDVGVPDKIDDYSIDINVEGLEEIKLTGIRLKPNPEEKRNETLEVLRREWKNRSEKKPLVLDDTKIDENGHIHIDDWNPYEGDSHLYEMEDEYWDQRIWEETTDEVSEVLTLDQVFS